MSDEYVLSIILNNKGNIDGNKTSIKWLNDHEDIKHYLENRFDYFDGNYGKVATLIKRGFKEWPKCKICHNFLEDINNVYCSNKCSRNDPETIIKMKDTFISKYNGVGFQSKELLDKVKETNVTIYGDEWASKSDIVKNKIKESVQIKYGYDSIFQVPEIKDKIYKSQIYKYGCLYCRTQEFLDKMKETCITKYGVDNINKLDTIKEKIKNTNLIRFGVTNYSKCSEFVDKMIKTIREKYGVDYPLQIPEAKDKYKKTCLERFGVEYPMQSEDVNQKRVNSLLEKYGVEHLTQNKDILNKIYDTKSKNNSFNTSKPEEIIYNKLLEDFPQYTIKRNYKEVRYPYRCDFYILELDLFIECNFHWTHGEHWFDRGNEEDLKILNVWKSKNSKFYNNAINVWTNLDLNKLKTATDNKLRYLVLWKPDDYDISKINNIVISREDVIGNNEINNQEKGN